MEPAVILAALGSGLLIGSILGLIGGGGSILAVPLLIYGVGITDPHTAIGTGAVSVAANALLGLWAHGRAQNVKWRCAAVFAVSGVVGASLGAHLGKAVDGQRLLTLFGLVMVGVGLVSFRKPIRAEAPDVRLSWESAPHLLPRLIGSGGAVGLASGFFGIGGGFLIVPGLMWATAMPMGIAVGTSLVGVSAFGAATTASYALSGLVNWPVAALMITGGMAGSALGTAASRSLSQQKRALSAVFGTIVILVGGFIVWSGL
ncbi:hypothetical protein PbB2_01475 [Candidatus Phycosocius bacilliformis]|uniref:Probable membrane transporter protein n=1 Tax=Candidatus Phycosocius bacilliformis TaxID=1445552 RepID=A0A2P2E9R6_9PROT|nr:sulfite exporter TauE/SafE family protein [Candidatus Phycosocius bacilliformis]GBF57805.1 hypothetical protein PbB2_01475 [Candidatus Phycosocius bacilliformis]